MAPVNSKPSYGGNHHQGGRGGGFNSFKRARMERSFERVHDRFCTNCGETVLNQAINKPERCFGCTFAMPLRKKEGGWMRCADCDSFINEDMMYCQMCGRCQNEVILKRERKLKAEAQSVHAKLLAKNKQLISEGMMNAKLLMEKQAEIDKLLALINENKTEETSGNAGLGTVNDLDVDDVDLSGIDDVNLGGSQSSALNSGVESDADAAPSGSGVNNG